MKTLELTEKEERALKEVLMCWKEACSSGCAFPEMQKSKKGCERCDYPKAITAIEEKLGFFE